MKNFGSAFLNLLGSAAAPGFAFLGRVTTGLFGRTDGGLGLSVLGVEVESYDANRRKNSREIDYAVSRRGITGGGILSYLNGNVKWTNRFIIIPVPNAISGATHINLYPPDANTTIPVVGSATPRTVTADGIPMTGWETLYAIFQPGGGTTYLICPYPQSPTLYDNYLPLVSLNADFGYARFATGENVYPGKTAYSRVGWFRLTSTSVGVTYDDGSTPLVFGQGQESRSFVVGYTMDYQITDAGTDNKRWRWTYSGTAMSLECVNDVYNAALTAMSFIRNTTVVIQVTFSGDLVSLYDNLFSLGKSSNRWKDAFLANQPTIGSDERFKYEIRDLSDAEIKAWEQVVPKIFRMRSVQGAGDLHAGYIAQHVERAFAAHGLDAFAYGIIHRGEDGYLHLRYGEATIFEAAYQRSRVVTLEKQVAFLAASLGIEIPEN